MGASTVNCPLLRREHLRQLEQLGANHVALNLRFQQGNVERTLDTLATTLLPDVPA